MASKVGVSLSDYTYIGDMLEKALNSYGFNLKGKRKVIIKVNLSEFRTPETGVITHPLFLDALLKYLRKFYDLDSIYVVESDSVVGLPDFFIRWFGFIPILQKWGAEYINLSRCGSVLRDIEGLHLKKMRVPEVFLDDAYFISLSKLKTSSITRMSCALKNQFGCIPIKWKSKYHPWINEVIADANLVFRPDFSIVDGIIGVGGVQGPSFGVPINARIFVYGEDPVAVDSVCAKIIGFNPSEIAYIKKSEKLGVGTTKYELVGESIKKIRKFEFNRIEHLLLKIGFHLQQAYSRRYSRDSL